MPNRASAVNTDSQLLIGIVLANSPLPVLEEEFREIEDKGGLGNSPFGRNLSLVSILKPMNILVIEISVLIRLNNSSFPIWI